MANYKNGKKKKASRSGGFWRALLILFLAGGLYVIIGVVWSRNPVVTEYTLEADVAEELRFVQLTDLHTACFGENNEELVTMTVAQKPDLIFLTGDMIDIRDSDPAPLCSLISRLSEIAPVYYCFGNHERDWIYTYEPDLKKLVRQAGATLLDAEYVDITLRGTDIRLGGESGYYAAPHLSSSYESEQKKELAFVADFESTERFKLLLCHIPTPWVDWKYTDISSADLILSGHYHGGLVRLFGKGLYAPYIGWLPKNTKGVFEGRNGTCILSAGLGGARNIPRVYNSPELVVINLTPAE